MAKSFENWLVVSDVDGTLYNKRKRLPIRNYEAILRFVNAGGHFTLASGRPVGALERSYQQVPCNVPGVVLNGAGIYDFKQRQMLWRHPMGEIGRAFVNEVRQKFPLIETGVFMDNYVYLIKGGILSRGQLLFDKTGFNHSRIGDVPQKDWCKVVFWSNPVLINRLIQYAKQRFAEHELNFMKTSPVSFEMTEGHVHKGMAVMKLAEQLGIERSHVAAIGDYYNDWDMLKTVGLPACAGQAPADIHQLCKFEACHCNHGCVADLINYIMGHGDQAAVR